MPVEDLTQRLCEHLAELRYEALPATTIAQCKSFVLDSFGVALAGHFGAFAAGLIKCAQASGIGTDAAIWGSGQRLPAANAAMVNAYLIHCQEFDAVHEQAVVHPFAVILASLVALAEERRLSGKRLIEGVVAGVEAAAIIGSAARSRLRFFRPAQCGALGAVVGAAVMMRHSADAMRNALGVCLAQLSGTMQAHLEGAPSLPMQIAVNARGALSSVQMSEAGLIGPKHALEGEHGYFALFQPESNFRSAMTILGKGFRIDEVSYKPFPSGRATHGGIDALQSLLAQHQLKPADVAALELVAPPLIRQLVDRPAHGRMLPGYAKLCFPWCAAQVLHHGSLDVEDFFASALADPSRLALTDKVRISADANPDPNALAPITLRLTTHSGQTICLERKHVLGSPSVPLSALQVHAKFRRNWALIDAQTSGCEDFIGGIERLEQVERIGSLLMQLPRAQA